LEGEEPIGPRLLEERGGGFTPPTELFLSLFKGAHRGDEEDIREEGDRAEEEEEEKEPIAADVGFAYLPLLGGADEEEAWVVTEEEEEVDVGEDEGSEKNEGEGTEVDGEEGTVLLPSSLISTSSSVPETWSSVLFRAPSLAPPPSSSPCDEGTHTSWVMEAFFFSVEVADGLPFFGFTGVTCRGTSLSSSSPLSSSRGEKEEGFIFLSTS